MPKRTKLILVAIVIALVGYFIYDATSLPGVGDLKGEFEEVAFYRNENNTGPIVRIYAVTVTDTLFKEMEKYGSLMPHTKYGTTMVYFFRKNRPYPSEVFPGTTNFSNRFKPFVIARYEKDAMGQVSFQQF